MKIGNIDRENLHMFWTTREISMKFSEKKWLMIMLKVTKNQGLTFSFEDTFLEKLRGIKLTPQLLKVNPIIMKGFFFFEIFVNFCGKE